MARDPQNPQKSSASTASAAPIKFGLLFGSSSAMETLYRQVARVAPTQTVVLIAGESGTGKELVANTLHRMSTREQQAFIPVNCGAIPSTLIEAELFGHEKGSFTGAVREHPGYFERASGGTLFLDEITEMPLPMQAKLLRVLETGKFFRVGGTDEINVDVRLIVATNREPWTAVRAGLFREDLMYRLNVFPLVVPALRDRDHDVELLALHFLSLLNKESDTRKTFSRRSLETIRSYSWPGNVRELKNTIHRAFILGEKNLEIDDVLSLSRTRKAVLQNGAINFWIGTPLAEAQREIILATLHHFNGNKEQTATTLGISLKTLYNRLNEYQ